MVDVINRESLFKSLSGNDPIKERQVRESYNEGLSVELEWLGLKDPRKGIFFKTAAKACLRFSWPCIILFPKFNLFICFNGISWTYISHMVKI